MAETDQGTKEAPGGTDPRERPKAPLNEICECKKTLDKLADLLLDADWDSKESVANVDTAKSELRNSIKVLNRLANNPIAKGVDIGSCLENVRKAHVLLTQATILINDRQHPEFLKYPEYIDKCGEHLVLASGLISPKCPD